MRAALVLSALLLGACGEAIDPPPLGDYRAWEKLVVTGPAPGHGDTYRVIYFNSLVACGLPTCSGPRVPPVYLQYPEGSVLVKEIYDVEGGELQYLAIMRRLASGEPTPAALTEEGGWLFSQADAPGGDEVHHGYCWARCHAAAPYNGAFYDYRQSRPRI